ncbi:MAG: beta-ketoacyl synthase chain length factor [Dokdonella sp.]
MGIPERGELIVHIEGIGWWSPGIPDWIHASELLREEAPLPTVDAGKPAATILPPNERRRAPAPVLLACEVAAQACAMADRKPDTLRCVFASMHGDIVITDDLCTTLATAPLQVSPTRFHNSVHNAPAGHWTVAAECHAASNAVSACRGSFAAGLLESAVLACTDRAPVLFAAYDVVAQGALAGVLPAAMPFGAALVINPERGPRTLATLRLRHLPHAANLAPLPSNHAAVIEAAPIANGLPLFSLLARSTTGEVQLPNGIATSLSIEVLA